MLKLTLEIFKRIVLQYCSECMKNKLIQQCLKKAQLNYTTAA